MRLRILLVSGWVSLAVAGMLVAQEPADPPSRVARLNYLDGSVSFRPATLDEWAPATVNFPLTSGDHLWVDRDSRAELHVGATALHLAPQTAFSILKLDDHALEATVSQGTLYLRVPRKNDDETIQVDTPSGTVNVLQPGAYRIDVDSESASTLVTVRSGQAEVSGDGQVVRAPLGQTLRLLGGPDVAVTTAAAEPDPWEDWCVGRDLLSERSMEISESYVTPELEGSEDLGQYGDWSADAIYGEIWTPRDLPAGWAPYRHGHWAYVSPWGWTWIDDAPWGFAPFHYGRWVQAGGTWVWIPGRRAIHPVYAPALVVFVSGTGLSASVAARGGRVTAWVPLGPGEVFHPNYRASEQYQRRVNAPDIRNGEGPASTEVSYVNRTRLTAVPQEIFTGARPVSGAALRLPPSATSNVSAVSVVDATPSAASFSGRRPQPGVPVATPPPEITERAVNVKRERTPTAKPDTPAQDATPVPSPPVTRGRDMRIPVDSAPPAAPVQRGEDPPQAPPVYTSTTTVNPAPAERQPRREEPRPVAPTSPSPAPPAPAPVTRREESRPAPTPPPPPAPAPRHEESRPAPTPPPAPAPAPRHEESRPAPPPPPAPAPAPRHEEARPAPPAPPPPPPAAAPAKDDRRDDRKK